MDEYEVIWSIESIYDAADIEDYIETEFGKDRADRFHNDIDFEVESLGRSYKLYADTGYGKGNDAGDQEGASVCNDTRAFY